MKIELYYDPVRPETTVCIDGVITDKADIYGFLFPVRHCLLQTWLRPSGSWSGLKWQLRELARGEEMELTFYGREEDFADVQDALRGTEGLALNHEPIDPQERYVPHFAQMEELIARILDENTGHSDRKTMADLFPQIHAQVCMARREGDAPWLYGIANDADYAQADQAAFCCCLVEEEYLDSFEKLDTLIGLTRSMRRGQDMICCCVQDDEKRADFAHYAAQYDDMRIRFDTKEHGSKALQSKYGQAFVLRSTLGRYEACIAALEQCWRLWAGIDKRKTELAKMSNKTVEQIRELEHSKLIANWFDRKSPYYIKLMELTKNGVQLTAGREE